LIETLFWFIERWGATYILFDQSLYKNIPPILSQSFSMEGGINIINFSLEKIRQNTRLWINESEIISQIIKVLQTFSKNKRSREAILSSIVFQQSFQYLLSNIGQLPSSLHSPFVQTIAYIATRAADSEQRQAYFKKLCNTIEVLYF
jgi:hypothetical protein